MRIGLGRFGNTKACNVTEGVTIRDALVANGFHPQDGEMIQDLVSNEYEGDEPVEAGQTYLLVQRTKSGNPNEE